MERFYHAMGYIALAIVFFCFVTPVSLCLRLAGRDRLNRKMSAEDKSYWRYCARSSSGSSNFLKQSVPK